MTSPVAYQVIQQNTQGAAMMSVLGQCPASVTAVLVRLTPVRGGTAVEQSIPALNGQFSGLVRTQKGWYTLLVSAGTETATVARVGVGEVYVVAGHSVAQGDAVFTLPGSTDERVVTIPVSQNKAGIQYADTGLPADLPRQFAPYISNVYPGPFGSNTHFWAKFGETVAQTLDCPVAVFNAAFGGTSLVHWAKSATGQPFTHSFVNSAKGFPYVNLKNALTEYVKWTGCRAVLMDQGQNDHEEPDAQTVFANYRTVVDRARTDTGILNLPVVINRQTPYRVRTAIRQAQERMVAEVSHCFAGPDYDLLADSDRPDGVHLSVAGQQKAAQWWADVVTSAGFRAQAVPYQPNPAALLNTPTLRPLPAPVLVVEPLFEKPALTTMFAAGVLATVALALVVALVWLMTKRLTIH